MGRVVVLGSSNTDLVLRTEQLPGPGETVLGSTFFQAAGGKGANQAVAAARAGAQVVFVAAFGTDDLGTRAYEHLAAENVDLRYARRLDGVSSGVALIFVDEAGQNQIGVALGANGRFSESDIHQLPDEVFTPPGVFVTQLETPDDAVLAGLRRARSAGLTTVFNPAPPKPYVGAADWLRHVNVLVVNEHEAQALSGTRGLLTSEGEIHDVSRRLLDLGCGNVIVTLGSRGYALAAGEDVQFQPGYRVTAVDAVAAGDAFVGSLASALSEGVSLSQAALWANKAAAISVTRRGAQPSLPYRHEIDQFSA